MTMGGILPGLEWRHRTIRYDKHSYALERLFQQIEKHLDEKGKGSVFSKATTELGRDLYGRTAEAYREGVQQLALNTSVSSSN